MNQYVTGAMIKELREKKNLTQAELAKTLLVSDKTVSKWETGKGYPDITLLESLSAALCTSVAELMDGECVVNTNHSANIRRSLFYVCPICGNVLHSLGEAVISCHGVRLVPQIAEPENEEHTLRIENVEDEYFVSINHEMTREHFISFIAAISCDRIQLLKLYPEGNAEARFKRNGIQAFYFYCNRDGLFSVDCRKRACK